MQLHIFKTLMLIDSNGNPTGTYQLKKLKKTALVYILKKGQASPGHVAWINALLRRAPS